MRIVISAAPNIQVTPLAEKFASENSAELITDPTRKACESLSYQTLYEIPSEEQLALRENLLREHKALIKSNRTIVCDFSAILWLAEWMRWQWSETTSEKWEEIWALAQETVAHYDKIVFVESGPHRDYDGYYWLDKRNSKQIGMIISNLHRNLGIEDKVETTAL